MKKGFTLIELLAVIVILAIIALIATPIILGIINDARKESNERSAELYASAVRNAIASYQLTHPNAPTKFSDLNVQYDGEIECETEELYKDGSFYISDCTVNEATVEYTYGRKKYEPQYYSWALEGKIGGDLPTDAKTTVAELNPSHPFYLGLDTDSNNKVIAAYMCFTRNGAEYCLKGNDAEAFATNNITLETAFKDIKGACSLNTYDSFSNIYSSQCSADGFDVSAWSYGFVDTIANGVNVNCYVDDYGNFMCIDMS